MAVEKSMTENSLWVERYRPDTLEHYVGNDVVKEKLTQYITENDVPHLLFYGTAGTGKCLDESEMIDIEIDLSIDELKMLENYIILE